MSSAGRSPAHSKSLVSVVVAALVLAVIVVKSFVVPTPSSSLGILDRLAASAKDPATYLLVVAGVILFLAITVVIAKFFDRKAGVLGVSADCNQDNKGLVLRTHKTMYLHSIWLLFAGAILVAMLVSGLAIVLKTDSVVEARKFREYLTQEMTELGDQKVPGDWTLRREEDKRRAGAAIGSINSYLRRFGVNLSEGDRAKALLQKTMCYIYRGEFDRAGDVLAECRGIREPWKSQIDTFRATLANIKQHREGNATAGRPDNLEEFAADLKTLADTDTLLEKHQYDEAHIRLKRFVDRWQSSSNEQIGRWVVHALSQLSIAENHLEHYEEAGRAAQSGSALADRLLEPVDLRLAERVMLETDQGQCFMEIASAKEDSNELGASGDWRTRACQRFENLVCDRKQEQHKGALREQLDKLVATRTRQGDRALIQLALEYRSRVLIRIGE